MLQSSRLSEMYEVDNGRYYAEECASTYLSRISVRAIRTASDMDAREVFVLFPIVGSRATKRKRRKSENETMFLNSNISACHGWLLR